MLHAKILSVGSYLPEKIMSNHDFESLVDTSDEWIVSRTGIKTRHIAATEQLTRDMAYMASIDAINNVNEHFSTEEIDLILVATSTNDMVFPSIACMLQEKLGLRHVPAFDLQAACAGFLYALDVANAYIKSQSAKCVLVVAADIMSRIVNYSDRNTCVLFGDGAGAMIVKAGTNPGVIKSILKTNGKYSSELNVPGHFYNNQVHGNATISMNGKAVFKFAVNSLSEIATNILHASGYNNASEIDYLVPHQANLRIIESTASHLGIPMDKVIVTVDRHGNTSAASIPLALDFGIKSGKIKRGDLLLLEGLGAGFTWGACLVRY